MFASEIKALLRHPDIPPEVDAEGVAELLLVGPGRTPGQGVFRNVRERLRTFSVDYRENNRYFTAGKFQPSADGPYIEAMADCLDTLHINVVLDPVQVAAALDDAAEARDLPGMADVDSSLLLFCREVRGNVTAALSGECADEIFGGYPWFRDPAVRAENGFPWAQSTAWRASFLTPEYAKQLDAAEFVRRRWQKTLAETDCLDDDTPEQKRVRRLTRLNMDWFMQTLLDRKDRMSMWSALEVRVPFCDWRIVEYLYNVPPRFGSLEDRRRAFFERRRRAGCRNPCFIGKKAPIPRPFTPTFCRWITGCEPIRSGCYKRGYKLGAGRIDKKAPRNPPIPGSLCAILSFDGNRGGLGQLLLLTSRQREFQDAVLKPGGHVLGLHTLAHIEAAAAGAGVPLLADIPARLVRFVLVQALGGADGQIAVLQIHADLVLLEAGQVDVQLIGVVRLPHVGLHQVLGVLPIQGIVSRQHREQVEVTAKEIVEQVLTKNTGHHKSFLHSYTSFKCPVEEALWAFLF